MNPFDFVKDIQGLKQDVIRNSENPEKAENLYNPFLVNRALSFYPDSIMYANEMNRSHGLDHLMQFDYLINSIRSMKRKHQWVKKPAEDDVDLIMEYFGMSRVKAREASKVLTKDQITDIKRILDKGGT